MEKFTLPAEEIALLKRKHKKEREQWKADRIKAIVLLGTGWTIEATSEALLIDKGAIRRYRDSYKAGKLRELFTRNYQGRKGQLDDDQKAELKAHLSEYTYSDIKSILAYVSKEYEVNLKATRMRELMAEMNFIYKKPKVVPGNVSPEKALNYLQEYEKLRREGNTTYFIDGVHPQHNSQPSHGWIQKGVKKALPSNTGRKRLNLNGAVNIDTRALIVQECETVNAQSTIKLFSRLLKRHKDDNEINVICDNAAYYRSSLVKEFLEKEGKKINLVFLPPYSPFLNLIERVWKYFKKMIIYNRYYKTFLDFKGACLNFFKRSHKRALKNILTEKFHFGGNLEPLKLAI